MSISIQIPMSLELSNSPSLYTISEQRAERLLSSDKQYAIRLGLWDRFKDYFRTERKAEVMERLYDFIHRTDNAEIHKGSQNYPSVAKEIFAFLFLKSLATDKHKSDFVIDYNPANGLDFYIGSEKIKTLNNCRQFYPRCEALFAVPNRFKLIT